LHAVLDMETSLVLLPNKLSIIKIVE